MLAVCGTYQLVKGPEGTGSALDTRKGSLSLYELLGGNGGGGGGGEAAPRLVERHVLELAAEGVLDCKWCVSNGVSVSVGVFGVLEAVSLTLHHTYVTHNKHRRPSSCQPHDQREAPLLACATSQGRVATYTLTRRVGEEGGGYALVPGPSSGGEEGGYMALALVRLSRSVD